MSFSFPSRLYPIVDTLGDPTRSYTALARAVLDAGVRFLQLRVKGEATGRYVEIARDVKELTDRFGAQLIVNDRADIARLIDAAGVHVGQDDLPPEAARVVVGPGKIVGFSTHNLDQVVRAGRDGTIDYVGFGPLYATGSKERPDPVVGLDGLRRARVAVDLPIVAIGGIGGATMAAVLDAGADAVAMIGEIVGAPDVTARVRELTAALAGSPA
ncbi:thiamine phosphate synthase [Candidatus Binatia bacterium]|nr:thiamine phosphate synthase [Candidatus Binatia bacterium]